MHTVVIAFTLVWIGVALFAARVGMQQRHLVERIRALERLSRERDQEAGMKSRKVA